MRSPSSKQREQSVNHLDLWSKLNIPLGMSLYKTSHFLRILSSWRKLSSWCFTQDILLSSKLS